jgi:RNA polymerase sigma-70 factor (sigma-E family)
VDEGYERFAERELDALLRYAVMLTGDRELARDLVQDVMIKAYGQWRRVAAADHPRLYVRTMITRAYLSWRRRWSVRHVFVSFDDHLDGNPIADHAAAIVDRDDVWRRLSGLPKQQRAVLVLRYYEHLTDDEIAVVLGCSAGTVRGYASRALAALRVEFTAELTRPGESS